MGRRKASAVAAHSSERRGPRIEGALLVLVSACSFATLPILVKLGLEADVGVEQMLTLRFVIAGIGMAVIAAVFEGAFRSMNRSDLRLATLAGAIYTLQAFALFLALEEVPAAFASLVLFTYPIIVVVAGVLFLGRQASRLQFIGLILSVMGTAFLVGGISVTANWALAAAFAAPFLYAGYLLLTERMSSRMPPLTLSAVALLTGGALLLLLSLFREGIVISASTEGWMVIIALALVPMVGIPALVAGLARLGATSAAIISTAEPAITVCLAALILSETIGTSQIVGGAFVLAAVILVQLDRSSSRGSRVRGKSKGTRLWREKRS